MTATAQDFLFFARTRRAAAQAEVDACDAAIAALTAPPVDPPAPDPEPEPPVVVDPGPVPEPNPTPVPNPPVVGRTVAVDATDLMAKVNALKGSGKDATIGLAAGHHDAVSLSGLDLGGGAQMTIIAEARRASKLSGVTLVGGCRNINFVGLGICPKGDATAAGLGSGKLYGLRADQTTSKITLDDMKFQGHVESANHAAWTLAEWRARGIGAAWLQGADSVIQRSYAEGVRFGFNLTGKGSVMRQLRVFGASGDGFRVSADNVTGEDLLATDLIFMNDGNHPDGFQAFGPVVNGAATPLRNLVLRRVALFEWTVRHDNPLRWNANLGRWGIMQGIGLHQTKFEDIVLDDIFVKTNVANGMHIGGAKNLSGQRWRVLSGDYGLASFDKRFPKIDIHGSGAVSINDVEAQALTTATAALVKGNRSADYSVPDPTWLAPLMGLAA